MTADRISNVFCIIYLIVNEFNNNDLRIFNSTDKFKKSIYPSFVLHGPRIATTTPHYRGGLKRSV